MEVRKTVRSLKSKEIRGQQRQDASYSQPVTRHLTQSSQSAPGKMEVTPRRDGSACKKYGKRPAVEVREGRRGSSRIPHMVDLKEWLGHSRVACGN